MPLENHKKRAGAKELIKFSRRNLFRVCHAWRRPFRRESMNICCSFILYSSLVRFLPREGRNLLVTRGVTRHKSTIASRELSTSKNDKKKPLACSADCIWPVSWVKKLFVLFEKSAQHPLWKACWIAVFFLIRVRIFLSFIVLWIDWLIDWLKRCRSAQSSCECSIDWLIDWYVAWNFVLFPRSLYFFEFCIK